MKHRIGIMQGRLSPRPQPRLEAFPHACWQREFSAAARLGLDAIEWIFEFERHAENPLWSREGRAAIRRSAAASGVDVRSVCADYFRAHHLAGGGAASVAASFDVLLRLIDATFDVGAERIVIPLLETSAVDTPELKAEVVESLKRAGDVAARRGILLGLEMDLCGERHRELIDRVGSPAIGAYYDIGDSTAQGRDVAVDVLPLLPVLCAAHVKDRRVGGGTVRLGTGDANFEGFFRALHAAGNSSDLVLQHYFDDDPREAARDALLTLRRVLSRAAEAA